MQPFTRDDCGSDARDDVHAVDGSVQLASQRCERVTFTESEEEVPPERRNAVENAALHGQYVYFSSVERPATKCVTLHSVMSSEYSAERRIEGIPKLGSVSKNEAAQATDETLTRRWEKALEASADDVKRALQKKRDFKTLLNQK